MPDLRHVYQMRDMDHNVVAMARFSTPNTEGLASPGTTFLASAFDVSFRNEEGPFSVTIGPYNWQVIRGEQGDYLQAVPAPKPVHPALPVLPVTTNDEPFDEFGPLMIGKLIKVTRRSSTNPEAWHGYVGILGGYTTGSTRKVSWFFRDDPYPEGYEADLAQFGLEITLFDV